MGKPPPTDQQLEQRVAALEDRADATDDNIAELRADTDLLIERTEALDARVTALEAAATAPAPEPPGPVDPGYGIPVAPPVIGGGPIIPPPVIDHTLPVPEPQPPIEVTPPTTGRAAIITLDGVSHLFTQEGGTDLGAYVDPLGRFVQHCIAARCVSLPDFTVFFRPDADGQREEVVFEFGRCHGNPAGSTLGAYGVVIARDGETLYSTATDPRLTTVATPGTIWWHPYYSRWRWQSAPRPVTRTAAELVAANLVPNYDPALEPFQWSQPPVVARPAYVDGGPMSLLWAGEPFNSDLFGPNGIPPNMTMTGDSWSLAILPEPAADYIMYEDAQALTSIRAWLEGSGCFSWILRDENTYAPLDFVAYPSANVSNWGNPKLPYYGDYQTPWLQMIVSCSHEGDLAYLAFQLTGDPYALEQMQFQTTQGYVYNPSPDDFNLAQAVRAYAWHLRDLAHTVVSTPTAVPSWMQPKSYWDAYLEKARAFALANGPNKGEGTYQERFYVMKNYLQGGGVSGYMEEFCVAVYQHMALLKLPGWDELADWMIKGTIARSNGTSGWNRSKPVAYDYGLSMNFDSVTVCADWAAAWNENLRLLPAEYAPPDWSDPTQTHLASHGDINYWQVGEAALAMAKRRGTTLDVDTSRNWLVPKMSGRRPGRRWAISA